VSPALELCILVCAGLVATCWLLSVVTREYSWVDRIWSIAPVAYVGIFALRQRPFEPRLWLMAVLVAAWGGRLTFNFARKGGYRRGGEDYRWAELRCRMSARRFALFNLGFIAGYQNLLLLLLALPAWLAAEAAPVPLGGLDVAAAIAFVALLVGETVADEQQWRFHQDKRARLEAGGPAMPRFATTGLFAYSRHPNFVCEQGMWWAMYLFGVAASDRWLNLGLIGPVLLTLLFLGSTAFTESITAAKYPEYAEYQRRVPRLLPWPRPRA
jgi:steroid 5-alpha reductase family enzyme